MIVSVAVLTAGCSALPIAENETSSQASPSATPIDTGSDSYQSEDVSLDDVLIQLSDLPRYYSPAGVSRNASQAGNDNEAIERKVERAFQLNQTPSDANLPFYVLSGAILYESTAGASTGVDQMLGRNLTSERSYSAASGHEATIGTFEAESGLQITIIVSQRKNLVYYALLAGPNTHPSMSKELMDRMYTNLPDA